MADEEMTREQKAGGLAFLLLVVLIGGGFLWSKAFGGDVGPSNSRELRASDFGDEWPLTVDGGTVACEAPSRVTFTVDGTTYSVNGSADSAAATEGWRDIRPIWRKGTDTPYVSIGPLIDAGLELC